MMEQRVRENRAVGVYLNHWYQAGLREDNFIYRLFEVSQSVSFDALTQFWHNVIDHEPHFGWSANEDEDGTLRLSDRGSPTKGVVTEVKSNAKTDAKKFKILKREFWKAKESVKFDGSAPLTRAVFLRFGDGSQFLILLLHHLVIDEVAMLLLVRDMEIHFSNATTPSYSSLRDSFDAYAELTYKFIDSELDQQEDYWRSIVSCSHKNGLSTDKLPSEEHLCTDRALFCLQTLFAPTFQEQGPDSVSSTEAKSYLGLVLEEFSKAQMAAIRQLNAHSSVDIEGIFLWAISNAVKPWRTTDTLWMDVMTSGRHLFNNGMHLFGARCSCVELCTLCLDYSNIQNGSDPIQITHELQSQRKWIPSLGFGYHAMELPNAECCGINDGPMPHPSIEFNFTAPVKEVFDREALNEKFRHTPFYLGPQYDPKLVKYDLYFGIDKPTGTDDWSLCIRYNTRKFSQAEGQEMAATLLRSVEDAAAALRN